MSKTKKIILPSTAIASSFYSVLFAVGLIVGYWMTKYFFKKTWDKGRIGPIFLNLGRWQIHLHHWLMGVLVLYLIGNMHLFPVFPKIFLGAIGGIIFHDLYFDKEWYRIVLKKK